MTDTHEPHTPHNARADGLPAMQTGWDDADVGGDVLALLLIASLLILLTRL